ncbi:MAG: hypothetical protein V1660_02490 [archaeon]
MTSEICENSIERKNDGARGGEAFVLEVEEPLSDMFLINLISQAMAHHPEKKEDEKLEEIIEEDEEDSPDDDGEGDFSIDKNSEELSEIISKEDEGEEEDLFEMLQLPKINMHYSDEEENDSSIVHEEFQNHYTGDVFSIIHNFSTRNMGDASSKYFESVISSMDAMKDDIEEINEEGASFYSTSSEIETEEEMPDSIDETENTLSNDRVQNFAGVLN